MSSSPPFVIFSLPRSRSAWLAHWLNHSLSRVGHDTLIVCDTPEEFIDLFSRGMIGTVETAGVAGWKLMRSRLPSARFVTIRRPLEDVERSLEAKGAFFSSTHLELLLRDAMLDEIELLGEAERIDFASLSFLPTRQWLWEYLLDEPLDFEWDVALEATNIQINMPERLRQLAERREANLALLSSVSSLTQGLASCPKLQ